MSMAEIRRQRAKDDEIARLREQLAGVREARDEQVVEIARLRKERDGARQNVDALRLKVVDNQNRRVEAEQEIDRLKANAKTQAECLREAREIAKGHRDELAVANARVAVLRDNVLHDPDMDNDTINHVLGIIDDDDRVPTAVAAVVEAAEEVERLNNCSGAPDSVVLAATTKLLHDVDALRAARAEGTPEPEPDDGRITKRTTDPSLVFDGLLLADVCTDRQRYMQECIAGWADDQRAEAFEWAMAAHLRASDNDDIVVPDEPKHVTELRAARAEGGITLQDIAETMPPKPEEA